MKAFIVVSCLVLAASAKPQGYNYQPPGTGISLTLLPPAGSSHQSFSVSSNFMLDFIFAPIIHENDDITQHNYDIDFKCL